MQRFNVQGMTCGHCVTAVTNAIRALDPHALVQVDLPTGEVIVESDIEAGKVISLIEEEGYQAQLAS